MRRQPVLLEQTGDDGRQIGLPELARREVYRDRKLQALASPLGALAAGHLQHLLSDLHDEAGFLRNRDEFARRDGALAVRPAQQRFGAANLVRREVDLGLVGKLEAAVLDRRP